MKKKIISAVAIVAVLALTMTIPQVQAFAVSALSVFRVGDAKTITITIDDIAQMSELAKEYVQSGKDEQAGYTQGEYEKAPSDKPGYKTLTDISEFTAFRVNLPRDLKDQQPELFATDVIKKSIEMQNGESASVSLSPILAAKYENVIFLATQGMNSDVSSEAKQEMWQKLLSAPIWTENIRSQLAAIDPDTKDIYLPVVTGISREADLGGTTGYLYAVSDMQSIMSALPAELTADLQGKMSEYASADGQQAPDNAGAIIWTKNGVLYALAGDLSDSELTAIARSVR